jgi:hypothetical protein
MPFWDPNVMHFHVGTSKPVFCALGEFRDRRPLLPEFVEPRDTTVTTTFMTSFVLRGIKISSTFNVRQLNTWHLILADMDFRLKMILRNCNQTTSMFGWDSRCTVLYPFHTDSIQESSALSSDVREADLIASPSSYPQFDSMRWH